jgi:hypothetical protein
MAHSHTARGKSLRTQLKVKLSHTAQVVAHTHSTSYNSSYTQLKLQLSHTAQAIALESSRVRSITIQLYIVSFSNGASASTPHVVRLTLGVRCGVVAHCSSTLKQLVLNSGPSPQWWRRHYPRIRANRTHREYSSTASLYTALQYTGWRCTLNTFWFSISTPPHLYLQYFNPPTSKVYRRTPCVLWRVYRLITALPRQLLMYCWHSIGCRSMGARTSQVVYSANLAAILTQFCLFAH